MNTHLLFEKYVMSRDLHFDTHSTITTTLHRLEMPLSS